MVTDQKNIKDALCPHLNSFDNTRQKTQLFLNRPDLETVCSVKSCGL